MFALPGIMQDAANKDITMRDSVVFYRSFWEAIEDLPEPEFKQAVSAVMQYALDGKEPDVTGVAKTFFKMAKPQIDVNNRRYQNGTKGGRPVTNQEPKHNQEITKPEPPNNQGITKEEPKSEFTKPNVNVNEKGNVKEKDNKYFIPPTPENVKEYCREKGYNIDAESFVDFYASKGWMVGKNKMKDWKAAVRNWARNNDTRGKPALKPSSKFHNFQERDYDMEELGKALINR